MSGFSNTQSSDSTSTETGRGGGEEGGWTPSMNGDNMLTPELLYKLNKKVAQLTKVSKNYF